MVCSAQDMDEGAWNGKIVMIEMLYFRILESIYLRINYQYIFDYQYSFAYLYEVDSDLK